MQCSWGKFQGTEHFARDRDIFEIEGSRERERESPLHHKKFPMNYENESAGYLKIASFSDISVLLKFNQHQISN